jgi:D-alanyl-D-alanine carboxypeptidase
MSQTTYANASGLPDSRQVTTARDQARLGAAIYEHYSDYYAYFQTRAFKYNGRSYGNHNRLLGSVPGVDGIKTGYIRASGYNLLTAARTDGRHIVVVGFGFDTGASRNAKVAALVNKYLPKARSGSYIATARIPLPGTSNTVRLASAPPDGPAPIPDFRRLMATDASIVVASIANTPMPEPLMPPTGIAAANQVAEASVIPAPAAARPFEVVGAWLSTTFRLDANTGAPVPPAAISTPMPPLAVGSNSNGAIDLLTSGSIGPSEEETDEGEVGWVVQIGAAPSATGAESLLASAAEVGKIGDFRRYVERFERSGQVFFRARIAGFADANQAHAACDELKKVNMSCLALQG